MEELAMEKSIDIRNRILRYSEKWMDISFLENLFSQKDGVLLIGTDPNEWWADYETIISGLKYAIGEMSGVSVIDVETKAYSEGTVGWSSSRIIMKMPDAS